ncbi:hypothetical protein M404DRAFT_894461 [Pisolithus tinctorius Marx 270]|uniref:Uncharacterized protein n=1 Tax=Pisolithus tinctorius Marx 270 TaxID=870435 RepID=A0A0C3N8P9_PISTI|nr:hypothetical protein M404DRAFT_894461 [Pisolithus tinctorius Marx 270]
MAATVPLGGIHCHCSQGTAVLVHASLYLSPMKSPPLIPLLPHLFSPICPLGKMPCEETSKVIAFRIKFRNPLTARKRNKRTNTPQDLSLSLHFLYCKGILC